MSIPKIELIVTDLDGTFFGAHGTPLEENAHALLRACARGIPIAIASGRLPSVCSRIAIDMGLDACHIIGLNGGHVLDKPFGETTAYHPFPGALTDKILSILKREGCAYNLYTARGVYTNQPLDEKGAQRFRASFERSGCEVLIGPDAPARAASQQVLKLLVKQTNGAEGYERAKAAISALPPVYLTTSKADNFEVMQRGVGKAEAVAGLCGLLGASPLNVMAFGDFDNDKPMLNMCGLSVAMGNSLPDVRAAAKYVTLPNTQAGVAYAVNAALQGDLSPLARS